ncbi:MAG: TlpA family protein disulfide reductase [Deltaproteobacteria bacterium]|nr:TlpA family protein disulfide reductase [Deltaproteobacteria bacterium]
MGSNEVTAAANPPGNDTADPGQKPVPWAPATTQLMGSSRAWVVPGWMKMLFAWCTVAMVVGLVAHKVNERQRYEEILVDTVMDPVPGEGTALPFSLPEGPAGTRNVSLADYRGKWVLVNFWATWCPPCREEMPSMEFLTRKFGDRMTVLAVSVDEDWNEVTRFFGAEKPSFKVLWDPSRRTSRGYGTEKLPESYVVSPDGRVIAKFIGPRDWNNQAAEEYFVKLLGG